MRPSAAVVLLLCASALAAPACSNSLAAASLTAPSSLNSPTNNVATCEKTADDASLLSRTLYWSSFPGTSISEVDLYLTSKDTSGSFTARLDISVNGASATSVSGAVKLTKDVDSFFAFVPTTALTVATGAAVRFAVTKVDGSGDMSYGGQTSAGCQIVTTASASSTDQIVGPKIPIRVITK